MGLKLATAVIGAMLLIQCGPSFAPVRFLYEIPYDRSYYRFAGPGLQGQAGDSLAQLQPGANFIRVEEQRFLQLSCRYPANTDLNREAVIMIRHRKLQQALPILKKILAKYPDETAALNNAGVVYTLLGQHDKALEYFSETLRYDNHRVYVYHYESTINLDARYLKVVKEPLPNKPPQDRKGNRVNRAPEPKVEAPKG